VDDQKRQMDEMKARRLYEHTQQAAYDKEQERIRKELVKLDREKQRQAKEARLALGAERTNQSKEHKIRTHYLEHVVYQNPVTDGFFDQFGQSCR